MMSSNRKVYAVPKPEKTKKTKSKSKTPTKTVNMDAVNEKRKKQNNINRNFGKDVERHVADITDGTRVPMSGAVKNSVHNLEGDVQVRSRDGKKVLALIECKGTSGINPRGEKVFNMKFSVLEQAVKEAALQHALPAVWVHPKGNRYEDDFVVIPAQLFLDILEGLREIYDIEMKEKPNDSDQE